MRYRIYSQIVFFLFLSVFHPHLILPLCSCLDKNSSSLSNCSSCLTKLAKIHLKISPRIEHNPGS
jgi:hypothetical protein